MNNAQDIKLTDNQLEMVHQLIETITPVIEQVVEILKKIYDRLKETATQVIETLQELLDKNIIKTKRKKKGNRYVITFTKKKVYKWLMRYKK